MTKFSVDNGVGYERLAAPRHDDVLVPAQLGPSCDLYSPGHLIHYRHQGNAVRSPAHPVRDSLLEDFRVTLLLDSDGELHWRHHDPERLRRILELLRGRCVAYPTHHALRVGPYWFNCAAEEDVWQECRVADSRQSTD